jgi:hypothetical protein
MNVPFAKTESAIEWQASDAFVKLHYLVAQEYDTYLPLTISRLLLGGWSPQCHFADPQYAAERLSCNALLTGDHRLRHSIALI